MVGLFHDVDIKKSCTRSLQLPGKSLKRMRRSVRASSWLSLSRHFRYVADHLRLDAALLRRLVQVGIMNGDEHDELTNECFLKRKTMKHVLRDILPRQDPTLFDMFCKIVSRGGCRKKFGVSQFWHQFRETWTPGTVTGLVL